MCRRFLPWIIFTHFIVSVELLDLLSLKGKEFEGVIINGNFNQIYHQHVNSERRVYFIYNSSNAAVENKSTAIRFKVAADKFDESRPLMIVVERHLNIYSWKLPVQIQNRSYFDFTRTLCPEWNGNFSSNFAVFIFSSASPRNIVFNFVAVMEDIGLITTRKVSLTPTSPVYFFHEIPEGVESVVVKAESNSSSCAVLSIQEAMCPVNDMIGILEHSRYYATMTKKGAVTITRSFLRGNSFFIILSMRAEDRDGCESQLDFIPDVQNSLDTRPFVKIFNVGVKASLSDEKLISAVAIGFFCFIFIYLVTCVSMVIYYYKFKNPCENTTFPEYVRAEGEETGIVRGESSQGPRSYGACDQGEPLESDDEIDESDYEKVPTSSNYDYVIAKPHLCVADMLKERKNLKKQKTEFFWDLVTVSIFYFLPVIQLVLNFQKTLNNTGDQDICYYNFYCIHQVGPITAFNSFFSNIGYVLLGLLFLFLVYKRESTYRKRISLEMGAINYGIPQRFDLFYAMGLALVMEGLLSACYHICPNYSNFQFDTSFMYVIGWLCMLKIYQNRHQDMSLKAHVAYSIIAFVVLFGVVGITEGSMAFWICFVIIYLLFIFYLSIQVYYLGHWQPNSGIFSRIYIRLKHEQSLFRPMYLDRLVLLIFGNLANWGLAIYGAIKMPTNFASYLLSIMLANFMMYFLFYLIMKVKYREKIFFMSYMFLSLAVLFWAFSLYFFFNQMAVWELSPALSREHNSDCLWLNFYDYHDIWHFLSALSLFFSFLVLLTLDDGLWDVPRDKIKVF